jgi:hypothetical protein
MSTTSAATLSPPPSVDTVIKSRRPLRNVHKEVLQAVSPLDRLALWVTIRVGSMGFFLGILEWTVCWLGWNVLAPRAWQFDPPMALVFWLFISNVVQILLMPLIMVGQNLMGRHSEVRAASTIFPWQLHQIGGRTPDRRGGDRVEGCVAKERGMGGPAVRACSSSHMSRIFQPLAGPCRNVFRTYIGYCEPD